MYIPLCMIHNIICFIFTDSVPSPTKYDPKIGDKVKGGCILKAETKHIALSDTASATSGKSVHTPIFRTVSFDLVGFYIPRFEVNAMLLLF